MGKTQNTRIMVEGAIILALSVVLSLVTVYKLPNGGSITAASMAPLVYFSIRRGLKWGVLAAFAYSLMQMLLGFYPPPAQTFLSFALVVLLDYVIAFTVLGTAGAIAGAQEGITSTSPEAGRRQTAFSVVAASVVVTTIRLLCHFISGMVVWQSYAEGQPVWLYSIGYNTSYMLPEIVITSAVVFLMWKFIPKK